MAGFRVGPVAATAWILILGLTIHVPSPGSAAPRTADPDQVRYHLGLLYRGASWTRERTPRTDSLQAGHMANIRRMWDAGILLAAGPFGDDSPLRGVFIFRADTSYDLNAEVAQDPAVASGRLRMELHAWDAPAGVGQDYRRRAALGLRDSMVKLHWYSVLRGPSPGSPGSPEARRARTDHLSHLNRLLRSGELLFSGTMDGAHDLQGVLLFAGDSVAARRAVDSDPGARDGRVRFEYHPWWTALGTIPGHWRPGPTKEEKPR